MQIQNLKAEKILSNYYFAFWLLATDIVFLGIHCFWLAVPSVTNYNLSLEADRGYAEIFQYIKLFWISLNFFSIYLLRAKSAYLAWVAFFLYLLLDDSLLIHEKLGEQISQILSFNSFLYLRADDYGELLASLFFFVIFLVMFGVVYRKGSSQFRKDSRNLAYMLAFLALFGVGLDMAHAVLSQMTGSIGKIAYNLVGILEDGGEMVVISLICYYSFAKLPKPIRVE